MQNYFAAIGAGVKHELFEFFNRAQIFVQKYATLVETTSLKINKTSSCSS